MDLPLPDPKAARAQAQPMNRRFGRAAWRSFCFVVTLAVILLFEAATGSSFDALALRPHDVAGLIGILTAPLLHASLEHLAANTPPLLILGTLAGTIYPRASWRAIPLIWIGSGLFAWFTGEAGSVHLGASGVATGLMVQVFMMGLLRRDRQAVAGAMVAFFLYGGMLVQVFPHDPTISWQMHMGGAIFGFLTAILWRRLDPPLPRKRYSWEDETDEDALPIATEPALPQAAVAEPGTVDAPSSATALSGNDRTH